MHLSLGIAGFPRRVEILSGGEHERTAFLGTRAGGLAVGDVAEIGAHAARPRAGGQTACAGAAVAIVENDRQARTAVEDAIEDRAQLLVANVPRAEARVGRDDRFIELVGLVGQRVPHLRTVAGEIEQQHIAFGRRLDQVPVERPQNGSARGLLIGERHDVALVEIVEQDEHFLESGNVVHGAGEIGPIARRRCVELWLCIDPGIDPRSGVVIDADQQSAARGSLNVTNRQ